MNLTSKLQALKEELKQREAEKNAAHNRLVIIRRLIKSTESLIKDAELVFAEENGTNSLTVSINTTDLVTQNGGHSFTEGSNQE